MMLMPMLIPMIIIGLAAVHTHHSSAIAAMARGGGNPSALGWDAKARLQSGWLLKSR